MAPGKREESSCREQLGKRHLFAIMMPAIFYLLLRWLLEFFIIPMLGLCLLHSLMNMWLFRRLRPLAGLPEDSSAQQDVTVLVPARNEERRIRACLASLIAQEPPVREIILLDDCSTDRTACIARELGFREGSAERLRLLRGEELPAGWIGKNWACHQLACAACPLSGHLLFTDADTIHSPGCVRAALDYATTTCSDLLSLWPDQITGTWSEKLVIPLGYLLFMVFQTFPILTLLQARPERVKKWGVSKERLASMGLANGQFLLFTQASYRALGGHESLKDHLVEDLAFGRRIAARTGEGMRVTNADGMELLQCRMYSGFGELWEGFSKNLRPAFEESQLGFFLFGIGVGTLFLLPFFLLGVGHGVGLAALIALLLIFLIRLLLTIRFRTAWLALIAHPFGIGVIFLIAMNSWRLCRRKAVSWKGRAYSGVTHSSHR